MFFLFGGCKKTEPLEGIYDKGKIEYKITYIENNLKQISPTLLPKKMKLEFNQDYSISLIEGFMGVFKLNNITYFRKKRSTTLLEVLDKNYLFNGKRGDEICCFEPMGEMIVKHTDEIRKIAGLNCKKAIITLPKKNETFVIYYTNDIRLASPNLTNPYKTIDGVLVEFQLKLSGVKMKFTANKFEDLTNHNLGDLIIPDNSIEVSKEQMTRILNKLME